MRRRERMRRMRELFDRGVSRQELFERFRDEVKPKKQDQVAFDVASMVDPVLRELHSGKIALLANLLLLQAVFMAGLAYLLLSEHGFYPALFGAAFVASIPGVFAYGIYRCELFMYNVYMFLMALGVLRALSEFWSAPLWSLLELMWATCLLALTYYVRSHVFPHYGPLGLKRKDSGEPAFPESH